jgi:hypothetical protein
MCAVAVHTVPETDKQKTAAAAANQFVKPQEPP